MTMNNNGCKVCVTGGSGYIGSWLIKKLLERGYTVHATLRNFDEISKVSLLKNLPGAEFRLKLFKADLYEPEEFEAAIYGCEFVFHVATATIPTEGSQYENTSKVTIEAAKSIARICERLESVKRLIFTASMVSASPMKHDGSGFMDSMDETCWTPLDLPTFSNEFQKAYLDSKTLAEKEVLSMNNGGRLEVVTLACGLVGGGDSLLPFTPLSVLMLISQFTNQALSFHSLKFLEELTGKIPIAHIDDVCEAHIFSMENPMRGRFLCANSFVSSQEIASYYVEKYPQYPVDIECLEEGPKRTIELNYSKLIKKGFTFKYDLKMILDGCISCAQRMGDL